MTRIELQVDLRYEIGAEGADFIFNIRNTMVFVRRIITL